MADAKSASTDKKPDTKSGDFGQSEVKQSFDEAQEKGYFGTEVDPIPNKEYSLETGPDSPTAADQREALRKAEGDNK